MANDSLIVSFPDGKTPDGKPHDLKVQIKRMPALQAERWYTKVCLYLARGVVSDSVTANADGWAGLISALSYIPEDKLFPLEDELLRCCSIVNGNAFTECDPDSTAAMSMIQMPTTITKMRLESLKVNFGFLKDDPTFGFLFGKSTNTTAESKAGQSKKISRPAAP